jgi:hypothetical protein
MPGVSRGCPGRITGARLIRDRLGWHVAFRIEEAATTVAANLGPPVGMDRGVIHTMALSNGEMHGIAAPSARSPDYGPSKHAVARTGSTARPPASPRATVSSC